ncbi:MAG: serine/threonine protein kinase [Kiritimatiellae bacterium]|nr:serine/threonine protein kinase [Kiritimatiellia bacterium]
MGSQVLKTGIVTERFDQLLCAQCDSPMDISEIEPFARIECPNCGHPATIPAKLGHFILLDLIGTGGMGGVYIAEDASLDRLVAIKVMLESLGRNAESIATFTREAQAAARLNHPNIAQIYSIGQESGQPYIVMELVAGQGLDRIIDSGERPSQGQIIRVAMEVAQALQAADETDLIHGDIKPENILLDEKGHAKLVDFGLASLAGQGNTEGIWGTPYYIAPEKVRGHKGDHRSDIYSLGATLYHVLSGTPPFDGETPVEVVKARLDKDPIPLSDLREDIKPEVERLVMRMLKSNPSVRYPTYASLIGDVRRTLDAIPRSERNSRRNKRVGGPTLVVTKRSPRVTQNIDLPPGEKALPGKRPKLVLKTKRTKLTTTASKRTMTTRSKRSITTAARDTTKHAEIKPKKTAVDPEVKARRARKRRVIFWSILLAAAVGGGAFFLYYQQQQKLAARREAYELAQYREAASNTFAEISLLTTNLNEQVIAATEIVQSATNAIVTIREAPLTDALLERLKPQGDELVNVALDNGQEEDSEAATDTNDVSEAAADTNAPPEDAEIEEDNGDDEKEDLPEEIAEAPVDNDNTVNQLVSPQTGGLDGREAPATGAETVPHDTAEVEEDRAQAEQDKPAAPPPPLLTAEEEDFFAAARIAIAVEARLKASIDEAQKAEEAALSNLENAQNAATSLTAKDNANAIQEAVDSITKHIENADLLLTTSRDAVKPLLKTLTGVLEEREAARLAAEEAARLQAEAEEAQRKEAERQALIAAEIDQAEQALSAARILLPQYRFDQAVKDLDRSLKACQTEEGKAVFALYRDRYRRLADLKAFTIECLNTLPQPWIWGRGNNAKDIIKADQNEITLKGGKKVIWEGVPIAQMLKFVNTYARHEDVRLRDQCNTLLNTAIYCREHGGETAVTASRSYAHRALAVCADLREESERLLTYPEAVDTFE